MSTTNKAIAAFLFLPACGLSAEIGSDARSTDSNFIVEPCQSNCDEPGSIQWSTEIPLERPALHAHSNGELVLIGMPATRAYEPEDTELRMLRVSSDGDAIDDIDLELAGSFNLDMAEAADGTVILASGGELSAMDLDGDVLWTHTIALGSDHEFDVEAGTVDGVFVGGTPVDGPVPLLQRYGLDGTLEWSRDHWPTAVQDAYDALSEEQKRLTSDVSVLAIRVDGDGDLVAAGSAHYGHWIGKFEQETGDEIWSRELSHVPSSLAVLDTGRYVVGSYRAILEIDEASGVGSVTEFEDGYLFQDLEPIAGRNAVATSIQDAAAGLAPNRAHFRVFDTDAPALSSWSDVLENVNGLRSDPYGRVATSNRGMFTVFGEYVTPARLTLIRAD